MPHHGPFVWGSSAADAVETSIALEEMAKIALLTHAIQPEAPAIPQALLDKHFLRKHGPEAYYGQEH